MSSAMGAGKRVGATFLGILSRTSLAASTHHRPSWFQLHGAGLAVRGGATLPSDTTELPGIFSGLQEIDPKLLTVERTADPKDKPAKETLVFGRTFTDHMLKVDWDSRTGWHAPKITPYGDLKISPAASALHYALECFEGMKAYRGVDGKVRLFRPDLNVQRLNTSMSRLHFPPVDKEAMIELISKLVLADADWIPEGMGYSLYIRPTAISTYPYLGVGPAEEVQLYAILSPVGPYYKEGFNPIKLYADTENVRAWPGGTGYTKTGGNYAPTILPQMQAMKDHGCAQILWLFGEDHLVTEVGAMNIFFLIEKEGGGKELITSSLDTGDILPGVTRRCVLDLAHEWGEFDVSERALPMREVAKAADEGRLLEVFGTGTAAVVSPVRAVSYMGRDIEVATGDTIGPIAKRVFDTLNSIYYGLVEHPWAVNIS
ncbi:unnamed protein product [Discosporangium mesarthrocarpum]